MNDKALSQEPCELLIIKSDIFLHPDDREKWVESIKREKESGVIILPPYFEPLLVPNDIEINIEQKSGKWIDNGFYAKGHSHESFHCSKCGHNVIGFKEDLSKYCPNCGAKMESEDKE